MVRVNKSWVLSLHRMFVGGDLFTNDRVEDERVESNQFELKREDLGHVFS